MPVIHPSLFFIMKRFPDHKNALRQLYRTSKTFQGICHNYKKCAEALGYWSESKDPNAPDRVLEYSELLQELEREIIDSLNEGIS